jgi:hypothetical protein
VLEDNHHRQEECLHRERQANHIEVLQALREESAQATEETPKKIIGEEEVSYSQEDIKPQLMRNL